MAAGRDVLAFGPFQLDLEHRVLREGVTDIRLNKRVLELLIALAERAGDVVTKHELLARGWPDSGSGEGVLRVHIASLRKALGDGVSGRRYVENVSGRGYRFVARVLARQAQPVPSEQARDTHRRDNLPVLLTRVVGRSDVLGALAGKLSEKRFVSVVGPGGIGKTTIAVALAEQTRRTYLDGVRFLDLSLLTEGRLVPGALAALLGGGTSGLDEPMHRSLAFLEHKSMLIVLDNCEHLTDSVADLADRVFKGAPDVHLLATSRCPLRANHEHVLRVSPLRTPPQSAPLTRAEALTFPGIQLFVERATACLDTFELTETDAPLVAGICSRLDGNPLAIELAAARIDVLGLQGLAARLHEGLQILGGGRRTAAARHQSLRATLDWSYQLLSAPEQILLRRLGVFNGNFDVDSASAVAADESLPEAKIFEHLSSLTAKSLVSADTSDEATLYRLPQYQREYALEKLAASGEEAVIRRRHVAMWSTSGAARFYSLRRCESGWLDIYGRRIDDIRAGLDWCWTAASDTPVGTILSLMSMCFEFILVSEYDGQLGGALASVISRPIGAEEPPERLEQLLSDIILQAKGPVQGLTAEQRLDHAALKRRTALWGLWAERLVARDHRLAKAIAAHFPTEPPDGNGRLVHRVLMVAHHYAGRQGAARLYAERILQQAAQVAMTPAQQALLSCDPRAVLSRVLWVLGFADQALRAAQESVAEALTTCNASLIGYSLLNAYIISIHTGDLRKARDFASALEEHAEAHSVEYYRIWARCLKLVLAIRSGDIRAPEEFSLASDPLSYPQYLDDLGVLEESLVSRCAIVRAERGRSGWCAAEILRVKGERLLQEGRAGAAAQAEAFFQVALETARVQEALSFELRVAMSLARLWHSQGRTPQAQALLSGVYRKFVEGFGTADLRAARALLARLRQR